MLQDDRMPALGGAKRGAPAPAGFFAPAVTLDGVEVTIGERHIQPFHARSVLEATGEDTFFHFNGNVAVKSGEIAQTALLTASGRDQIIQLLDNFVDRVGGHTASYSTAIICLTKT